MKTILAIFLVDWFMGTIIIGVFAIVCITLVWVIMNMVNGDKKIEKQNDLNE